MNLNGLNHDLSFFRRLFDPLEKPPIMILNDRGEIVYLNSACENVFDSSYSEIEGKQLENLLAEKEIKGKFFPNSFRSDKTVESKLLTKEGEEKEITWEVVHTNPNNKGSLAVCFGREGATGESLEGYILDEYNEAKETAQKYKTLFEYAYDAILFSRFESGRIFEANPEAENLLGFKTEELLEKKLSDIFQTGEIPDLREKLEENRFYYREDQVLNKKDGSRIIASMSTTLIEYRGEKTILSLFHDMTERIELEKELRNRAKSLKESNEKLEEIIQIISHDLKEPLRSIGTYSDMLYTQNQEKLSGSELRKLENLKQNASRLKEMMDDVSNLTRITMKGTPAELEIPDLVRKIKGELAFNGSEFDIKIDSGFPGVQFDRFQLKVVLKNLISNAYKYNSEPKRVKIGYEKAEEDSKLTIFVRDNGKGIAEEYQETVFKMFEQLNPEENSEGMGAGLAFCKRIIRGHGGEISLESTVGEGSTFYITIPEGQN
ncbi:PAS domain S-box protein [Candidatus Bipolaricaulota bacterium]|nr:PAS domain S-box protein [Candidatus Bipolaricaulota bacterium]